ncbi:hypothetical protein ACQUSY_02630 [Microbacterium sp. YY-03]|uniref:tetratricopeptide repeat protein n=1 Tax=Microbacterium sp. YY-03 TaxID=3421636 RepID=UPI003D1876B6
MSPEEQDVEQEAIARDRDLAWELYEAQPDHPKIPEIVASVLARSPQSTGQIILLARHYQEVGRVDEARDLLHDLMGRRDRQYANAARELRDLEHSAENFDEAVRLARIVLEEEPGESWSDLFDLGRALTFAESPSVGWPVVDAAVAQAAAASPERYADAVGLQATHLLESLAPPDVIVPVIEEAVRLNPTEPMLSITLTFAYLYTYRPIEAEDLILRVLREDPTDQSAQFGYTMAHAMAQPLREGLATIEELRDSGLGEYAWLIMYETRYDCDAVSALAALDEVMPDDVRRSLRPPLSTEQASEGSGESQILSWHDGQEPGSGALWGAEHPFRLLSDAEITATEAARLADPTTAWVWGDDGPTYMSVVATDDDGNYLLVVAGGRLVLRNTEDHPFAPSLANWLWDLAVNFGAPDPRPSSRLT